MPETLPPEWRGPTLDLAEVGQHRFNRHLPDYYQQAAVVYADRTGAPMCSRCATGLENSGAAAVAAYIKVAPVHCAECGHEIPR